MTATEQVILVDKNDQPIGIEEKLAAHQKGLCHRAFSVFIYRKSPELELLLQKRAGHKYHSPGLWTNTCCSHPRPHEDILEAGKRRLKEEMGLEADLRSLGHFHYIAHFDNGLVENEIDHVLIGQWLKDPIAFNPDEVADFRWTTPSQLKNELSATPALFTPWLNQALEMVLKSL